MKRISVLSILLSISSVYGLNVDCEAGLLSTKIDNPSAVSELVLTGSANASDFYFIERSMPALRSLDMSGLKIEAYSGAPLGGISYYKADEIPAAVFAAFSLTEVVLPAVCSVGNFAFAGCHIYKINIPAGVNVGDGAFSCCPQLTTVTVGADVTLGQGSFCNCEVLESVVGSEYITVIPAQAFKGCVKLSKFDFGSGLKSIGEGAFAGSSVKEANMGTCTVLESIAPWVFAGDAALEKATLPAQLCKIGQGVFFECTTLSDVTLPEGMTELPAYTFKDVASMSSSLVLPENVSSVGEYALMGVSSVSNVELPASLSSIGEGAMEDMTSLTSIDALSLTSVPALGEDVWAGVKQDNVVLNVDPSVLAAFESTPQWQEFNIQTTSTSSKGPVLNEMCIRAAFDGYMLVVESTGENISNIVVCDIAGKSIYNKSGIESESVIIDTSHHDSAVYIIDCTLSDGTCGSVKILR